MNRRISLVTLLLTLTACGASNTPVSTLPGITIPTDNPTSTATPTPTPVPTEPTVQLSIKTNTDNKAEIVAYVESLGIDLTQDINSTNPHDSSRHANSRRRNASTNSNTVTSIETKYNIAKKKYERAKNLLNEIKSDKDEILSAAEDIIEELLKFFFPDWWKAKTENETGKDIIENKNQSDLNIDTSDKDSFILDPKILNIMENAVFETKDTEGRGHVDFTLDENGNLDKAIYRHYPNGQDREEGSEFIIADFDKEENGILISRYCNAGKGKCSDLMEIEKFTFTYNGETITQHIEPDFVGKPEGVKQMLIDWAQEDRGNRPQEGTSEFNELLAQAEATRVPSYVYEYEDMRLGGTSVGLSYSEFGAMTDNLYFSDEKVDNPQYYVEFIETFFGGYTDKLVTKDGEADFYNHFDNNETFTGRALGAVTSKRNEEDTTRTLDGTAKLTVNPTENKQILELSFDNFYDLKFDSSTNRITPTSENKSGEANLDDYFVDESATFYASYYGDGKKASEAVGKLHYNPTYGGEFNVSFGAKK